MADSAFKPLPTRQRRYQPQYRCINRRCSHWVYYGVFPFCPTCRLMLWIGAFSLGGLLGAGLLVAWIYVWWVTR